MQWWTITLLICSYGVLKAFRPSEPYLYQYEHETLNISEKDLEGKVYPLWTYSYMAFLVPVFLLTDLLLYKPVVVLEAIAYVTCWVLFVFGRKGNVLIQQLIEVSYGVATATEIAYYAYIYIKVDKEQYKKVTSYTHAALLIGKCLAYFLAQLLIATKWTNYKTLNWISLGSLCLAFVVSVILPMVSWRTAYQKLLEMRMEDEKPAPLVFDEVPTYPRYVRAHFSRWFKELKGIYSQSFLVKWSLWWAMASCAYFQVGNYSQTLWGSVHGKKVWNGITEAICPLIAIPVVLLMQKVEVDWKKWGELFLCLMSLIDGALLAIASQTSSIYLIFNLASRIRATSTALVFGLNTFVALVMQSILTAIVADQHGLALDIRPQFVVYACFHGVIAVIFSGPIFLKIIRWSARFRS
ncbi:unnamed protein product, partial [Mesorhabditis spiculigera]